MISAEVIQTTEFDRVGAEFERAYLEHWLRSRARDDLLPEDNPATLGLHIGPGGEVRASHFVGIVWANSGNWRARIEVGPKQHRALATVIAMARACLNDAVVAAHLQRTLWFWPDEPLLPCAPSFTGLEFFAAAIFLQQLSVLCRRDLRRGFSRVKTSLCGRARGRILVTETTRTHLAAGRPHVLCCQFQAHGVDTMPNRVLRCALEKSQQFLHRHSIESPPQIADWIAAGRAALQGVPIMRIERAHLTLVSGHSASASTYRAPLAWARRVLLLLGADPGADLVGETSGICPFAIDMNELFERYCEALLRSKHSGLKAFYADENLGHSFKVRPDFLLGESRAILDAKYKYDWDPTHNRDHRADVIQLLAYSRHRAVLERLPDVSGVPSLYILYPAFRIHGEQIRAGALETADPILSDDLSGVRFFRTAVHLPE